MPDKHDTHPGFHDHPEPGQPWSDRLAQWYIEQYGDDPTYTLALQVADLAGTETLLDIGCGGGAAVFAAADILPQGKAIGIDPTPAMIRTACAKSSTYPARQRIRFIEAPAETLPLEAGSVDVAITICALHHWGDIKGSLLEIARVLKPGGRLIVVEHIFTDPDMAMDIEAIRTLIDSSPFTVTNVSTQSHANGRAHILQASSGDTQ
ncbi:MAG: class I SAM-dependent methyltransferase [Alphaproteobacteria bacterium]|nr:class I SAM-dependent methyltransferase [Alphaproteobacteria bacterium]